MVKKEIPLNIPINEDFEEEEDEDNDEKTKVQHQIKNEEPEYFEYATKISSSPFIFI